MTDPVGVLEIAKRLGVQPRTVHQWRHRAHLGFPVPAMKVSGVPIWDWGVSVLPWARQSGRL